MTGDDVELELWYQAVTAVCRTIDRCRERIESAKEADAAKPGNTQSIRRQLAPIWPEMVTAALALYDLQARRPPSHTHRPTSRELREAELRKGVPPGTFLGAFSERPAREWLSIRRSLEIAKDLAEAEDRASDPSVLGELRRIDLGSAITRICCATMVGALVGAPLGALAIQQSILEKMYEAAVVTGVTALATEIYGPLSVLASLDQPPAEPIMNWRTSAIDAVMTDMDGLGQPGSLPDLDELPTLEPRLLPEPPDAKPPRGPKEPGGY